MFQQKLESWASVYWFCPFVRTTMVGNTLGDETRECRTLWQGMDEVGME